jgi:phosphoenolpyruvate---glycerone phosphotransferase subunit DhaL
VGRAGEDPRPALGHVGTPELTHRTVLTLEDIAAWLERAADGLQAARDELTELDAAIGDADHGFNMDRGFHKVRTLLPPPPGQDIAGLLKAVGMTLISSVGGAAGPLYGTSFLRAGGAAAGRQDLSAKDVGELLQAMLAGIVERGKAAPGAKTMVDALMPAVDAYHHSLSAGVSLQGALEAAVQAADDGVRATIPMQATKGRASYLGERSIGHQDPGATSCALILRALQAVAAG